MAHQILHLHTPVEAVDGTLIRTLTFRPAHYAEVLENDPPFERVPLENGVFYQARNSDAMKKWIKLLLVEPLDKSAPMRMTDARDFAALEAMIHGFFTPPDGAAPSETLSVLPEPYASAQPESPALSLIG